MAPATASVLLLVLVVPVMHVLYESFVWTTLEPGPDRPSVRNYAALAEDEVRPNGRRQRRSPSRWSACCGHLALGLGVALLLNQEIRGRAVFRNLALLPWMLPPAVVATGWAWLYHNPSACSNPLLTGLGLLSAPRAWLASPDTRPGRGDRGQPVARLPVHLAHPPGRGCRRFPARSTRRAGVDGAGAWAASGTSRCRA